MIQGYQQLTVFCKEEMQEILIAELAELDFESFMQEDDCFYGYTSNKELDKNAVELIISNYIPVENHNWKEIAPKNWNSEWEANFKDILIANSIHVRGTFHPKKEGIEHEIIIDPKMSFGTGHHASTYLMLAMMLKLDFKDKKVLDLGCGTGILAVMAEKLGAAWINAVDNNPVCIINTKENLSLNNCIKTVMEETDVYGLDKNDSYDIILANINRNVLLDDMEAIKSHLRKDGKLALSGFFERDSHYLEEKAKELNLELLEKQTKDNWACLLVAHQS